MREREEISKRRDKDICRKMKPEDEEQSSGLNVRDCKMVVNDLACAMLDRYLIY
jgi:hypothetical protein